MGEENDQTVLVVDGDPDVRVTLAEGLAERGWVVVTEPNGRTAIEHLKQGLTPCAILVDTAAPVMEGVAFRQALRDDPSLCAIPVVVLSGASAIDTAAAHIPKPFEIETVVRTIQRVCTAHSHLPS